MNNNWEIKQLGDICDILDSKRKPITKRDRIEGEYPYYGATGILSYVHNYIFDEKLILIGEDGAKWGSLENTAFIAEGKYWVNNHAHVIRPNRNVVEDNWIVYFLNVSDLLKYVTGLTVPKLNQEKMRSITIPIPPLAEQQRIVAILDDAFAAIAQAKENAEKNLQNARELFDSYLQSVFANPGDGWEEKKLGDLVSEMITGPFGSMLHKSDYVSDGVPVVNPQNIINGEIIPLSKTMIAQKKAEQLRKYFLCPKDIVIARRGEMGRCAVVAENQSGWLCGTGSLIIRLKEIANEKYVNTFLSSSRVRTILEKASIGATMSNLNQGILLQLGVTLPPINEQRNIIGNLETISTETKKLENIYRQKINDLDELKKSILQKAFSGELTAQNKVSNVIEFPVRIPNISATDLQAGIVATAFQRHQEKGKVLTFGHVKAEKIVHLAQEFLNIELEREPVKDAAGPNDFPRLLRVQSRAEKAGFFYTNKQGYGGYTYTEGSQFDNLIEKTKTALAEKADELTALIDLLVPMDTQQAELVATVYAAWNNLLIDNLTITDESIVSEAREDWHKAKLKIERERFFKTISWMKENNLIPQGKGKKVSARPNK